MSRLTANSICYVSRLWRRSLSSASALIWIAVFSITVCAQNIEFTQGNVSSGLHNTLQIQLKAYPGRGASLPINLYYSTAGLWRIGHLKTVDQGSYYQPITEAIYGEFSTAGWKSSLDLPIIEWPRQYDGYFYSGGPYNFTAYSPSGAFRVRRVYIHMPDGSRHELRENDQPYRGSIDMVGTFHAVDGSRLRYDSTGPTTGTLYLPDGSRYELFELNGSVARFIDRNGNTLRYDGVWRDTLNRPISRPLNPTPGTQEYYLPGMPLPYRFVWKNLSDAGVLTNPSATIKPIANEYLPNPGQEPTNSSGNNYPVTIQSSYGEWPSLFVSDTPDDGALTLVVGRGQEQDEPFNPVVLTEIIYPNGLSYKFSYNIYGEIDKIVYPTGAYEQYTFSKVPDISGSQVPYIEANRAVTKRQLSANGNGNDIEEWTYSVEAFGQDLPPNSMRITTKNPANTYTEVYRQKLPPPVHNNKPFWAFGFEDGRNGMVFDERIYAPNADGSKGPMLRRSLTEWQSTENDVPPRLGVQGEATETAYRKYTARQGSQHHSRHRW